MQELNTNTENIIETLKEIASTPEIKKYCYSTGFHLFEYAVGFEENNKFTGVVIYNQKVFYLERSTIIELDVNINNLINNYSKELKTVIKEFKRNLIDDGSLYNPEKINIASAIFDASSLEDLNNLLPLNEETSKKI